MANAQLAIDVTSDVSDTARSFDKVGDSAQDMERKVQAAGSKMDVVADASDNMASSSAQAAGGLGDLGGALALMPGPLGAVGGGMEALSPAIMGVTGASDLLNLATKSTIVVQTKAKISAFAHAVATTAQSAATKVAAAGQWALNAAMAANPIGLVIIAVIALIAGFVLLYKKSETFRKIVQVVGRAGKAAIGWIIDATKTLIGWVGDRLPGAFNLMKNLAVGYIKLVTLPMRLLLGVIKDVWTWTRDKLPKAFSTLKEKVVEIGGTLLSPFQQLFNLIKDIVGWIGKIKMPDITPGFDLPDLNPFGRLAPSSLTSGREATTSQTLTVQVNGSLIGLSEDGVARQLIKIIDRENRIFST